MPDHTSLEDTGQQVDAMTQAELRERYQTLRNALRYIAERASTIDDARRAAAEALEDRVVRTVIHDTDKSVTEERQSATAGAKSQPATQGSSPTNADKLVSRAYSVRLDQPSHRRRHRGSRQSSSWPYRTKGTRRGWRDPPAGLRGRSGGMH